MTDLQNGIVGISLTLLESTFTKPLMKNLKHLMETIDAGT